MADLNSIVVVNISKQTTPLSRQSFSDILIVGPNPTFGNRIRTYSDLATLAADLTNGTADPEYIAAAAIFAQTPRPTQFKVGREDGGDATITVTLTAIALEDNKWFGLIITDRVVAVQKLAGDYALANSKLFACASAGTDIGGGVIDIIDQAEGVDTTSIAALFKNGTNENAYAFYKADAATKFTDAAAMGRTLALDPGTYTLNALFPLAGETIDVLTTTQIGNVHDKNANTFLEVGGANIPQKGTVATGEYVDIIVFAEYLPVRIQEDQFKLLLDAPKVSFTDSGINRVNEVLKKTLKQEQSTEDQQRGISEATFDEVTKAQTGGFFTVVPLASSIPSVDKANRELNNVQFTAFLSGAIHKITINGILTL
ncbi:MAG: DUF3383 family protein [Saprospiraceae bacterium]